MEERTDYTFDGKPETVNPIDEQRAVACCLVLFLVALAVAGAIWLLVHFLT
jgi:hypothetical protein